jgi:hypothetical protein
MSSQSRSVKEGRAGVLRSELAGRAQRDAGRASSAGLPLEGVSGEVRELLSDELVDELLAGARSEEEIVGRGGLLSQLTKRLVERAMDVELTDHLGYEHGQARPDGGVGNTRNGSTAKTLLVERAVSLGELKDTKTRAHRTVRLLAPLQEDLRAWRQHGEQPADSALVFPGPRGQPFTKTDWDNRRRRSFDRACTAIALYDAQPYDLRHSFASLLLHEGRSVMYVARQLGHAASLTLSTYGHVIDELNDSPQ